MRLSTMEFVAMNNFVRRWILKWIEFQLFNRFLREHNVKLAGSVILDVGCGSGHSTKLIGSQYKPRELVAFDMMPEQIELAKRTYREARFFVGDATEIDSPSDKYDAVFVFGVLHHIPKWKIALREIHRVLKPGGVLLIEEVNKDGVDFVERYLHFYHPKESRFDWPQFVEGLQGVGFDIIGDSRIVFGVFHAYFCMKAATNGR